MSIRRDLRVATPFLVLSIRETLSHRPLSRRRSQRAILGSMAALRREHEHGVGSKRVNETDFDSSRVSIQLLSLLHPLRSPRFTRQRPESPSPPVRPPPPIATVLILAAPPTAKQLQAEWPTITPALYPRNTETIRSTPPSSDHKSPTRQEKILLNDPIVSEDLTAWLNAQGLRTGVTRYQIKGRKKESRHYPGHGRIGPGRALVVDGAEMV